MNPTSILRASTLRSVPAFRAAAARSPATATPMQLMLRDQRRWATQDNRGGKSKLIFRFGLRDVPVELYPMAFVVAAACVGAAFAVARHFYLDGLRLGPSATKQH